MWFLKLHYRIYFHVALLVIWTSIQNADYVWQCLSLELRIATFAILTEVLQVFELVYDIFITSPEKVADDVINSFY